MEGDPGRSDPGLAGAEAEGMDQASEAHVAHDGPAQFDDLFLCIEFEELVEQLLVDVGVVDEQTLGVVEGGLLGGGEVLVAPGADFGDRALFERVSFP